MHIKGGPSWRTLPSKYKSDKIDSLILAGFIVRILHTDI